MNLLRALRLLRVTQVVAAAAGTFVMASCLVVTDPKFEEPTRSAPQFLPDRAAPDLRQIVKLDRLNDRVTFSGLFVSEDLGAEVQTRLFIDYGVQTGSNPYRQVIVGGLIPAGSLEDPPRQASVEWNNDSAPLTPGCHRMTLVIAHEFGNDGCPRTPADFPTQQVDYDMLTWTVVRCDPDCPEIDLDFADQCPPTDPGATCSEDSAN